MEAADRAVDAAPRNAETLRVAGIARITLAGERTGSRLSDEGRRLLQEALEINGNLEARVRPWLDEPHASGSGDVQ
jgi:hypothetical protein